MMMMATKRDKKLALYDTLYQLKFCQLLQNRTLKGLQ